MQRGVKYNIRISRNEVEEFTVDEMILGMTLFLIVFFLLPTIIMYYICGVMIILLLVFMQICFISFIKSVRHFPFWGLAWAIKVGNLGVLFPCLVYLENK